MSYDEHDPDRALDAQEATADAAIAREARERKDWLDANDYWLRKEFVERYPELWAAYQQEQWDEYIGGEE